MTSYHARYDPTYYAITTAMEGWDYGDYKDYVVQHITVFVKQYTGFKINRKKVQYGMSTQIYLVVLSGSVPIKYQNMDYSIPINIVLPQKFPIEAPKVFLAYNLDPSHATTNPLIKYGNQVLNNYIHKWDGTSQSYNLGGLWYNLSKSFSLYPPFGTAGSGTVDSDVIYINDGTTKAKPVDVIKQDYTQAPTTASSYGGHAGTGLSPSSMSTHATASTAFDMSKEEDQIKYLAESARKQKLKQLYEKLQIKVDAINSSISGLDGESKDEDLITQSKKFLDNNREILDRQTLILENEMAEMKEGIEFIKKNENREINASNIDDFVFPSKDGFSEVLLEIITKESAIEDTIDLVKSYYRKKAISLDVYLEQVRELSEKQFFNLAMKRKVLSVLKGTN